MTEHRISTPLRLYAPAKVNLGLEVIGRREDGYHEVSTVMETVSLFDVIDITPANTLEVVSDDSVPDEEDLVRIGLERLVSRAGISLQFQVCVRKNIPVAAGLGGGSSDVGTILAALQRLLDLDPDVVRAVADSLGSDVPFFLRGGVALATGTGTTLQPIRTSGRRWYVILVPSLEIPSKTAVLYSSLTPDDFSEGTRVRDVALRLEAAELIDPELLTNTFQRPLAEYEPVRSAASALYEAGATHVLPSGAGPALFTVCQTFYETRKIASRLSDTAGSIHIATSVGPEMNLPRIANVRA